MAVLNLGCALMFWVDVFSELIPEVLGKWIIFSVSFLCPSMSSNSGNSLRGSMEMV